MRHSGPLLRVGKEKACVPDGLRDHARVGRKVGFAFGAHPDV